MKIKAIRGTKDILPVEIASWRFIEKKAAQLAEDYGYRQIRTPILEEERLFYRSVGSGSDIVRKQMYSLSRIGQRRLCLRPEATASVVRAYLEHGLDKNHGLAKFYYLGPMFRAERPQAGRLRQFHHIGVEAIGSASPYLDAEVIDLAAEILRTINIKDFELQINSIGCLKDRQAYKKIIHSRLKARLSRLCADCKRRYKTNILRIFDCKNQSCKKIVAELPTITDYLCAECNRHFTQVKDNLGLLGLPFSLNPHLVRGLDYYSKTCFEIVHPCLGAQSALGAGGRYDNLVGDLGGESRPAIGFALGIERLIRARQSCEIKKEERKSSLLVYVAVVGEGPKQTAVKVVADLRKQGIASEIDYLDKSLKGQLRLADRLGAKFTAILGEDELAKGVITLRNMQTKNQREVAIEHLSREIR